MTGDQPIPDELGDLTADLFATREYVPEQPPPRHFYPWHRPRKQYVRREQWATLADILLSERNVDLPLRYLGLPGVDLLDLRYLYSRVCASKSRGFRFLGFTSEARPGNAAHVDLHTSLDEVRRLDNVDPRSDVIGDDFRSLAQRRSIARRRFELLGPFDIVNLDLCDGIAADSPTRSPSLYDALAYLVTVQARNPHPWLLFITTRVGRGHFDPEAQAKIFTHYLSNIESCEDFRAACQDSLGVEDPSALDPDGCSEELYLRLMMLSLCKWLLALTRVAPARIELKSSQSYTVEPVAVCPDLVSFALRIDPVVAPPADPLEPGVSLVTVDECVDAARLALRVSKLKDVDVIIAADTSLEEELVCEMEDLLHQARYDVSRYRSWLEGRAG